jgi:hypothetical protein
MLMNTLVVAIIVVRKEMIEALNGVGFIHKFKVCECLLDQCFQHFISFVIFFQINRNA